MDGAVMDDDTCMKTSERVVTSHIIIVITCAWRGGLLRTTIIISSTLFGYAGRRTIG